MSTHLSQLPLEQVDPADAWQPWRPTRDDPWTPRWAAHLYRRAALGAPSWLKGRTSWEVLQDTARLDPESAVEQLLHGAPDLSAFDRLVEAVGSDLIAPRSVERNAPANELRGWWLYRLLFSPHPLRERMTLFWHNHFATSVAKVRNGRFVYRQNQLLREHALGRFGPMLMAVSRDPAMLVWLDANSNVKSHPNENFARELMELFSLGVGNYTEKDVQEAARAFTGWHYHDDHFEFNAANHDDGPKTVLGLAGQLKGEDVVRLMLEQPCAARFLVRKVYRHLVSESQSPSDALLEPLTRMFRDSDYDIRRLVATILRSRLFFSRHAWRQRIKSPIEFVCGLVRTLDARVPMQPLVETLDEQGQSLFAPPNVKGWDGGRAWLNTATLLARGNFAAELLIRPKLSNKVGLVELVARHGGPTAAEQVDFMLDVFLQGGVAPAARNQLVDYLQRGFPRDADWEQRVRETAHAVTLLPEFQLA